MKIIGAVLIFTIINIVGCSTGSTYIHPGGEQVGTITMPRIIAYEDMEYPLVTREYSVEGTVEVLVRLDSTGRIKESIVISRHFNYSGMLIDGKIVDVKDIFDPLAIKFINSMVFEPALDNGIPIEFELLMPVSWQIIK